MSRLYSQFDGVTYYMQRVMNELFSKTAVDATCVENDVSMAVDEIIAVSSPIYEDLMYQLPEKQSRVLIAVAKDGSAENVTSGKFIKRHGLVSPNSVKSAIPALIDKGLLTQDRAPTRFTICSSPYGWSRISKPTRLPPHGASMASCGGSGYCLLPEKLNGTISSSPSSIQAAQR